MTSLIPTAAWLVFAILPFVCAGLVFYALRSKGDVRAEFSHGSTMLKLEAKNRRVPKHY